MSTFYAPRACLSEGRAAYPSASAAAAAAVPETLSNNGMRWHLKEEKDALGRNALFFDFTDSGHRGCSSSALDVEAKSNTLSVIVLAATL